jgi:hypothetical protein
MRLENQNGVKNGDTTSFRILKLFQQCGEIRMERGNLYNAGSSGLLNLSLTNRARATIAAVQDATSGQIARIPGGKSDVLGSKAFSLQPIVPRPCRFSTSRSGARSSGLRSASSS